MVRFICLQGLIRRDLNAKWSPVTACSWNRQWCGLRAAFGNFPAGLQWMERWLNMPTLFALNAKYKCYPWLGILTDIPALLHTQSRYSNINISSHFFSPRRTFVTLHGCGP